MRTYTPVAVGLAGYELFASRAQLLGYTAPSGLLSRQLTGGASTECG